MASPGGKLASSQSTVPAYQCLSVFLVRQYLSVCLACQYSKLQSEQGVLFINSDTCMSRAIVKQSTCAWTHLCAGFLQYQSNGTEGSIILSLSATIRALKYPAG